MIIFQKFVDASFDVAEIFRQRTAFRVDIAYPSSTS